MDQVELAEEQVKRAVVMVELQAWQLEMLLLQVQTEQLTQAVVAAVATLLVGLLPLMVLVVVQVLS